MEKKLLLVIIIGMIIAGGIGWFFSAKEVGKIEVEEKPKVEEKPEVKEKEIQPIEEALKIMIEAAKKRDSTLCQKLVSEERKKQCQDKVMMVLAIDRRDTQWCEKVKDETARFTCKDNLILVQAIDTKNPILCEKMNAKPRIEICKKRIAALK